MTTAFPFQINSRTVTKSLSRIPWLMGAAGLLFLASCQTFSGSLEVETLGEADRAQLDQIEEGLVSHRAQPSPLVLEAALAELAELQARPSLNRQYQARIRGLQGEASLLLGRTGAARDSLRHMEQNHPREEHRWLLAAWLAPGAEARLALLEEGLTTVMNPRRLGLEKGLVLLELGRFREAAADLDQALESLPPVYREVYGNQRNQAFQLRDQAPQSAGSQQFLAQNPLSLEGLIALSRDNSSFLAGLSAQRNPSPRDLLPLLVQRGYLPGESTLAQPLNRAQAAGFLWKILVLEEGRPELERSYTQRAEDRARRLNTEPRSPVADLPFTSPHYDAVLGTVEREILTLLDGSRFGPEGTLAGAEYLQALDRLKALYP